ncbi:MAG: hypothetical protein HYR89_08295 [Actinobacteria bacterium]|nr:hypothetical protein [Actinomycetota bacterium]MBI3256752.1 hypothetical protein [Actinomycetota bacterium]
MDQLTKSRHPYGEQLRRNPKDVHRWLEGSPSVAELAETFPREWQEVQHELGQVLAEGDEDRLVAYIAGLSTPRGGGYRRRGSGRGRVPNDEQALLSLQIRRHLAAALLRQMRLQIATGVTEGRIRFNLLNGFVAQKLLFARGLDRKPVSLHWFRLVWPLLWQKRLLMPLVEPKGIYCFYSKPFMKQLAAMIGKRSCLEIAAGDGTLARFLEAEGVSTIATDDYSWSHSVTYPETVLRKDAAAALRRHQPEVVICSWPPAGNRFEREVFRTRSVQLYIVIGSHSEHNSGNWADYKRQSAFTFGEDPALSRLVLPPEVGAAVYVFRRHAEPLEK